MFASLSCSVALLAATFAFHAGERPFSFAAPAVTAQLGVPSSVVRGVVWYPASASAREVRQTIGDSADPLFEAGAVAAYAPLAPSPQAFPLILVSHGTGGSALQMAWLGTALARAGFIAVAIDHPGNTTLQKTVPGFTRWPLRARALSLALDAVLADPTFGPHVDRARIGTAGFSIGGYTALALAGARANAARLVAFCTSHPALRHDCDIPEFPGIAARARALARRDPAYRRALGEDADVADGRIRSAYAVAPGVGLAVAPASLKAIRVPVRIAYGTADTTVPPRENALRYAASIPGATLLAVPGAAHYTFLDTCTPAGARVAGAVCRDAPAVRRDAAHLRVARDAVAFFERTLR